MEPIKVKFNLNTDQYHRTFFCENYRLDGQEGDFIYVPNGHESVGDIANGKIAIGSVESIQTKGSLWRVIDRKVADAPYAPGCFLSLERLEE